MENDASPGLRTAQLRLHCSGNECFVSEIFKLRADQQPNERQNYIDNVLDAADQKAVKRIYISQCIILSSSAIIINLSINVYINHFHCIFGPLKNPVGCDGMCWKLY